MSFPLSKSRTILAKGGLNKFKRYSNFRLAIVLRIKKEGTVFANIKKHIFLRSVKKMKTSPRAAKFATVPVIFWNLTHKINLINGNVSILKNRKNG